MKLITDITNLDKPIQEHKIKRSSEIIKQERETHVCIMYEEHKNTAIFHSDHKVGIKWAINQIIYNNAKLIRIYLEDGYITSISIETLPNYIQFKSKGRSSNYINNCFSKFNI